MKQLRVSVDNGTFLLYENLRKNPLERILHVRIWNSCTNFYSLGYFPLRDFVATPTTRNLALTAREAAVDRVDLQFLSQQHASELAQVFEGEGWKVQQETQYVNWVHATQSSFAEYFSARCGRLRNTLRRKEKKLNSLGKLEFRLVKGGPDLEQAIDAYCAVYAKSWKSEETFPTFIPGLIRQCAKLGILALGFLEIDRKAVAVQFWIVDGQYAYIYKLAHDEAYSNFSVGSVLTERMLSWAYATVDLIDFGIGDEAYKQEWMSERRAFVNLVATDPTRVRAKTLIKIEDAGKFARQIASLGSTFFHK